MPSGTHVHWYYRPTNSARYPRSPKPGMVDQAFMTELRPKTEANGNTPRGLGNTPRTLGTPRATPRGRLETTSQDSYKNYLDRISRPTVASRYRFDCPSLSHNYVHRTQTFDQRYIWNRLPLLEDSYRCMWSRHGAVKEGTKLGIRAQNV